MKIIVWAYNDGLGAGINIHAEKWDGTESSLKEILINRIGIDVDEYDEDSLSEFEETVQELMNEGLWVRDEDEEGLTIEIFKL